jgi:hypothetical protein
VGKRKQRQHPGNRIDFCRNLFRAHATAPTGAAPVAP